MDGMATSTLVGMSVLEVAKEEAKLVGQDQQQKEEDEDFVFEELPLEIPEGVFEENIEKSESKVREWEKDLVRM